jgi:hypothetical protein
MKEKKESNVHVAMYVVGTYGPNVSNEKLIEIAKLYNFKPNVFIKNYKTICLINSFFE